MPSASRLNLTSPAHYLIHSITLSQLSHSLSHTATSPQAVKHRQSVATLSHCRHTITSLQLSTLSSLNSVRPYCRQSHCRTALFSLPLSSSSPMASRPRSTSISIFFFFFFWVQFISNSQYEFVFVIVILKGKIIDPKFVFRISVFMFVIVFGFVLVFVILGWKIID